MKKIIRDCGISLNVYEVGLKLSPSCPNNYASLDGIVFSFDQTWGIEIKFLYSKFNSSLQDAIKDKKLFWVEGDHGIML